MDENAIKITMLEGQIKDTERVMAQARSQMLNIFIDLQVMLDEDEIDEAREMLKELTS